MAESKAVTAFKPGSCMAQLQQRKPGGKEKACLTVIIIPDKIEMRYFRESMALNFTLS
jgi:hypothetical protein